MPVWDAITEEAAAESPLWATMVRPLADQDREPVFSPLSKVPLATALETIYEAYLIHFGRPRLFAPPDADTALLLGDYLYALGLAQLQALREPRHVGDFAELISALGHVRTDGCADDGLLWAATAAAPGHPDLPAAREAFATTGDTVALKVLVLSEVGEPALERALAAHRARVEPVAAVR